MLFKKCDFLSDSKKLQLTKTQTELAEKFTAAFYNAQNDQKNFESESDDLINLFDDSFLQDINNYDNNDDFLLDFLISKDEETLPIPENIAKPSLDLEPEFIDLCDFTPSEITTDFESEFSTSTDLLSNSLFDMAKSSDYESLEEINFFDFELNGNASKSSFDAEDFNLDLYNDAASFEELDKLPPVTSITRNNVDFSNFLRNAQPTSLSYCQEPEDSIAPMGHLIGINNVNNNVEEFHTYQSDDKNHIVLFQNDALLRNDPLLSCNNIILMPKRNYQRHESESQESEISTDCDELFSSQMQCKWANCYQVYDSQASLVKHIEKIHVEVKRGEEFTCYWINCPRKNKPFNARYKLLIHMRVHSGEKPNKCPFETCDKAFSRLENLKIHQRSHTGERPYVCQFENCTKSFSNSSDRAKHQRTHFDTKPYACQVAGCIKKYTDPSSLRKHVKNHSYEEQLLLKKRAENYEVQQNYTNKQSTNYKIKNVNTDHSYTSNFNIKQETKSYCSQSVREDLKSKISAKRYRNQSYLN